MGHLLPNETLTEYTRRIKAEALREAIENVDYAGLETYPANEVVLWLRARADEIERGGDRG